MEEGGPHMGVEGIIIRRPELCFGAHLQKVSESCSTDPFVPLEEEEEEEEGGQQC